MQNNLAILVDSSLIRTPLVLFSITLIHLHRIPSVVGDISAQPWRPSNPSCLPKREPTKNDRNVTFHRTSGPLVETTDPPADCSLRPLPLPTARAYEGDVESSRVSQIGGRTDEGDLEKSGVSQIGDGSSEGNVDKTSEWSIGMQSVSSIHTSKSTA